jgi:tetratricopeptide (TPR) repeat protein
MKGTFHRAVQDCNRAIELDPQHALAYFVRAGAYGSQHEYDKVIADYSEVLRLMPAYAEIYRRRAKVNAFRGECARAVADYGELLHLAPDDAEVRNALAWHLATCPDPKVRDGKRAVEHATRGCELTSWGSVPLLETLAAGYAEAGQFEQAVKWQTRALDLTPPALGSELQARLELYRTGKPYHEAKSESPPTSPGPGGGQ